MKQGNNGRRPRRNNNQRRNQTPLRAQTFDSNGPEGRIRGTAHQVYEKYLALARDAAAQSDRIRAESLFQHAEHYSRIINETMDPEDEAEAEERADNERRENAGRANGHDQEGRPRGRGRNRRRYSGPRSGRGERGDAPGDGDSDSDNNAVAADPDDAGEAENEPAHPGDDPGDSAAADSDQP